MNKKYFINYLILLLPSIIIGGLLAYSGDVTDGLKIGFLSLLGNAFIALFHKKRSKIYLVLAILWYALFLLHSMTLSAIWLLYNSKINAYFIVQSIANTSLNEATEYFTHSLPYLGVASAIFVGLGMLSYFLFTKIYNRDCPLVQKNQKSTWILPIIIGLLCVTAWAIKPIRAVSPPIFWRNYVKSIQQFKAQLVEHKNWQHNWTQYAQQNISKLPNFQEKQTVILIISESLTSYNLHSCGYPRHTNPNMFAAQNELTIFCNAYSGYPSTLGAVKSILTDMPAAQPEYVPTKSILADAKSAGFKTFWLSNQDDSYIASLFGAFTDQAIYNNKRSGRSSFAKDEELFPLVKNALADNAPKKLIVVHLIGSHPNYSARYTDKFKLFPTQDNAQEQPVQAQLTQINASSWTKNLRDEYDNSVAYQDWVFNNIFTMLKQDKAESRGLIFLSDHGNEVGHVKDFAGHSPTTQAGYRIPVVLWHNQLALPKGVNQDKAIDATQLDDNLRFMIGLQDKTNTAFVPWWADNYQFPSNAKFPYWENL
ncbi:phosphoethanolamine transferase [Kingella kingae]|uniref:phosphoethanolamine transferase n=1 Tax=Kingella kingae TaxID=504 RepID=UPI000400C0F3|nr:phosphoethanolamine transferase [Kingella kingae]